MGLAGPKNRVKLSKDPNNTQWSNDTERFGRRMLEKQGWKPGTYLGARDAAHQDHYSAASSSHIRVLLKDDNLGLGAKRGAETAEKFGLNLFENLLGRLNGKGEAELKKEEDRQRDVGLKQFVTRRWGTVTFVSGGYLVGDKMEDLVKNPARVDCASKVKAAPADAKAVEDSREVSVEGKRMKRKRRDEESEGSDGTEEAPPKLKRKKSEVDLRSTAEKEGSSQYKKDKKDKKKRRKDREVEASLAAEKSSSKSSTEPSDEKAERKRRKAEKKARKEAKKLKKEKRKAEKKAKKSKGSDKDDSSSSSEDESEQPSSGTGTSTPATGVTTPLNFSGGRLAVRQRYIRQKKLASADAKALAEIFMIKSQA